MELFQIPNSGTKLKELLGLCRVLGESSVSSFGPVFCVPERTHQVFFLELTALTQNSASSLFRNSSGTDATGQPGDRMVQMIAGSILSVPCARPLRPCAFGLF